MLQQDVSILENDFRAHGYTTKLKDYTLEVYDNNNKIILRFEANSHTFYLPVQGYGDYRDWQTIRVFLIDGKKLRFDGKLITIDDEVAINVIK